MTDGGVMMGLPRVEALELAAQSEQLVCMIFYG
jgi:pyrroline-5-carboxylate reductase